MHVDDKNIEPSTNLSLALGYSNHCIQKILNNDPGAGANAASTVDLTFVAASPLSELIWSPHKGLCLRCADGSFSDERPSLSLGVGPSNMASGSSSEPIPNIPNTGKHISNEICIASLSTRKLTNEVTEDNSSKFPTSNTVITPLSGTDHNMTATGGQVVETKTALEFYFLENDVMRNNKGEDEPKLDTTHNFPTCEEPIGRAADAGDESRALGMEIVLASEFNIMKGCEGCDKKVCNAASFEIGHQESPPVAYENRKNKMAAGHPCTFLMDKLESTAENDLEAVSHEKARLVLNKSLASEYADRVENNIQKGELLPTEVTPRRLQSNQRSGRFKALSDRNENKRMLNEDDGSHESVESCNSAGLSSTGKRQWNSEQRVMVGSKRVKKEIQGIPGSSSLGKHDSSFVNWISNMMKGFLKSSEGEAPYLSATPTNSSDGNENPDKATIPCSRKNDPASKTIGFQSIFQSLYCGKTKGQEVKAISTDHQTDACKECVQENKLCDLDASPVACHILTGNISKQLLPSNVKLNESASGNQADISVHSVDTSMSYRAIQEHNSSISTEKRNSCELETVEEKDGTNSNSSQRKHKGKSVCEGDPKLPSDERTGCNFGSTGDLMGNLWIARFAPKTSASLLTQSPFSATCEAVTCFADSSGMKSHLQNPHGLSSECRTIAVGKQSTRMTLPVQNYPTANGFALGSYNGKGHHGDSSVYKLNPIVPVPGVKTSEAIASVFARRLDTFKHISPSAQSSMTCLFCGIGGHDLQECPKVTDSELDNLLRNINLNGGLGLPNVCIRCFQHNHWAISCPNAWLGSRNPAECKMQHQVMKENDTKAKNFTATANILNYGVFSGMEKYPSNWKSNTGAASEITKLNVKLVEQEISSSRSGAKGVAENGKTPFYGFNNGLMSDIPVGVLDAIRSLRLTRTNILKWIKSSAPLTPLDGYFVRLRFGKWEEGLGGTGYYVARITGARMESSSKKSRKSIAVNVGGLKCMVEIRYVSNHDFLEDELQAWWSATSKDGDKLPSEEELRLKVEEKSTLGF